MPRIRHTWRLRLMRRLTVGAMTVGVAGALAQPVAADTTCSFSLLTRTVSVEVQGDPDPTDEGIATIARDGDLITVNGSTCTFVVIPATVLNTDRIVVTGSAAGHERVVLQPGLASAGVLVEVDLAENPSIASQRVILIGTDAPDAMTVGDLGADQDGDGDVDVKIKDTTETPAWQANTGVGNDIVTGQGGAGTGQPTEIQMVIVGGLGDDTLTGGASASADFFFGGPGINTLDGGDVQGQTGGVSDTARYDDANPEPDGVTGVTVDLAMGTAHGIDRDDTLFGIEYALGSAYDDVLWGDENNNTFEGLGGCDEIDGRGGTLDRVSYNNSPAGVEVDLRVGIQSAITPECDQLETFSNIQGAVGSHHNDTIIGDDGPNNLQGLGGSDILIGLDGDDSLFGQDGNDAISGGAGDDIVWLGGGNDIAHGGSGVDLLTYQDIGAGVEVNLALQATGGAAGSDNVAAFENVQGSQFDDTLTGDDGDNVLVGMGGDDTLNGGAGDDTLDGREGNDTCDPSPGNDTPVNCEG